MSKSVKKVVGVVAAIAIPFVAPMITGAIAGSTAIASAMPAVTAALGTPVGATLGSAIVGAGLGAVSAKLTGGNVGRSALLGGIGGGLMGYMQSGNIMGAANTAGVTASPYSLAGGQPVSLANPTPTFAGEPFSLANGATPTGVGLGVTDALPTDIGATLSGTGQPVSFTGEPFSLSNSATFAGEPFSLAGPAPTFAGEPFSLANPAATTASWGPQASFAEPVSMSTTNYSVTGGQPVSFAAPTPTPSSWWQRALSTNAASTGGQATEAAPKTFSQALKAKLLNPNAQADFTLRAAAQLVGAVAAGDGLSDEEKALVAQQAEELRQLRTTNEELFKQRLQEAQNLLGEAKYFNPEYFGLQAERDVKRGVSMARRDAMRGIGSNRAGLRRSEERRFDLAAATGGGTAYLQGADAAQQNRLRTLLAGVGTLPQSGNTTALQYGQYLGGLYDAADRRRRGNAADIGELFGSFTGRDNARNAGLTINYG